MFVLVTTDTGRCRRFHYGNDPLSWPLLQLNASVSVIFEKVRKGRLHLRKFLEDKWENIFIVFIFPLRSFIIIRQENRIREKVQIFCQISVVNVINEDRLVR